MISRSVPKPAVQRHMARWAESKRFLEVVARRRPRPNAGNRHGVVVQLWCKFRVPDRDNG